jgi:hypothetical protein
MKHDRAEVRFRGGLALVLLPLACAAALALLARWLG